MVGCKSDESVDPFEATPYQLDLKNSISAPQLPQDNPLTVEGIRLGRHLFYDPILSDDSTQSCGSCHNQKLAFTDNGKDLSVGIRGLKGSRNSMPIFNLAWHTHGFFWDGRAELLRHQALMPIEDPLEMDESLDDVIVKLNNHPDYPAMFQEAFGTDQADIHTLSLALEQFMLSIVSVDSKFDRVMKGEAEFTAEEARGAEFFNTEFIPDGPNAKRGGDCFHCHGNSLFMAKEYMNNGLDTLFADEGLASHTGSPFDQGLFKVPSVRNIALTAPYMHDGRFETLEEVLDFYSEGVEGNSLTIDPNMHALTFKLKMTDQEKSDLIAFLNTLTDTTFINNTAYSNPFK
jgi:cytochrome c peroxidase